MDPFTIGVVIGTLIIGLVSGASKPKEPTKVETPPAIVETVSK